MAGTTYEPMSPLQAARLLSKLPEKFPNLAVFRTNDNANTSLGAFFKLKKLRIFEAPCADFVDPVLPGEMQPVEVLVCRSISTAGAQRLKNLRHDVQLVQLQSLCTLSGLA